MVLVIHNYCRLQINSHEEVSLAILHIYLPVCLSFCLSVVWQLSNYKQTVDRPFINTHFGNPELFTQLNEKRDRPLSIGKVSSWRPFPASASKSSALSSLLCWRSSSLSSVAAAAAAQIHQLKCTSSCGSSRLMLGSGSGLSFSLGYSHGRSQRGRNRKSLEGVCSVFQLYQSRK